MTDKDLHLPTQQQLLAQFRCTELSKEFEGELLAETKLLQQQINEGTWVKALGKNLESVTVRLLQGFDQKAGRYNAEIYLRLRGELSKAMQDHTSILQLKQIKTAQKKALDLFYLVKLNQSDIKACYQNLASLKTDLMSEFEAQLHETFVDSKNALAVEVQESFLDAIETFFAQKKDELLKEYVYSLEVRTA